MMTKGQYWVGDLCYVIDDDCGYWDEVCKQLFKKDANGNYTNDRGGEYELSNGIKYAIYGTAWGDGGYQDQNGKIYGVDAGVIGCIKVDDIEKLGNNIANGGHVHEFTNDFVTGYDDGTIYFGNVRIETDPEEEDDDYSDSEDWDDEDED